MEIGVALKGRVETWILLGDQNATDARLHDRIFLVAQDLKEDQLIMVHIYDR